MIVTRDINNRKFIVNFEYNGPHTIELPEHMVLAFPDYITDAVCKAMDVIDNHNMGHLYESNLYY